MTKVVCLLHNLSFSLKNIEGFYNVHFGRVFYFKAKSTVPMSFITCMLWGQKSRERGGGWGDRLGVGLGVLDRTSLKRSEVGKPVVNRTTCKDECLLGVIFCSGF